VIISLQALLTLHATPLLTDVADLPGEYLLGAAVILLAGIAAPVLRYSSISKEMGRPRPLCGTIIVATAFALYVFISIPYWPQYDEVTSLQSALIVAAIVGGIVHFEGWRFVSSIWVLPLLLLLVSLVFPDSYPAHHALLQRLVEFVRQAAMPIYAQTAQLLLGAPHAKLIGHIVHLEKTSQELFFIMQGPAYIWWLLIIAVGFLVAWFTRRNGLGRWLVFCSIPPAMLIGVVLPALVVTAVFFAGDNPHSTLLTGDTYFAPAMLVVALFVYMSVAWVGGRLLPSEYKLFSGRINRLSYWLGILLLNALPFLGVLCDYALVWLPLSDLADLGRGGTPVFFSLVSALMVQLPITSLNVKRCHDINVSGWFVLVLLLPVFGALWYLIEVGFRPGTIGENRYGPHDPR